MFKQGNLLALCDNALRGMMISGPAGRDAAGASSGGFELVDCVDSNGALPQNAGSGEAFYKQWLNLSEIASQKAASCTKIYEQCSARVREIEDQKNACYIEKDKLTRDKETAQAEKGGLDTRMREVCAKVQALDSEVKNLENKVRELEEEKSVYDVLRWIPIVNLISELIAEIKGVRNDLYAKTRQLEDAKTALRNIRSEQEVCASRIVSLEGRLSENEAKINALIKQLSDCQAKRDAASKEMVEWKDREKYYKSLSGAMKHLVEMEAAEEEFQKLLKENPPPFELAA